MQNLPVQNNKVNIDDLINDIKSIIDEHNVIDIDIVDDSMLLEYKEPAEDNSTSKPKKQKAKKSKAKKKKKVYVCKTGWKTNEELFKDFYKLKSNSIVKVDKIVLKQADSLISKLEGEYRDKEYISAVKNYAVSLKRNGAILLNLGKKDRKKWLKAEIKKIKKSDKNISESKAEFKAINRGINGMKSILNKTFLQSTLSEYLSNLMFKEAAKDKPYKELIKIMASS